MNETLRITVAQLQTGDITWREQPYHDVPGAVRLEYPTVTDTQLQMLQSGVPQNIDRVLSQITNLR